MWIEHCHVALDFNLSKTKNPITHAFYIAVSLHSNWAVCDKSTRSLNKYELVQTWIISSFKRDAPSNVFDSPPLVSTRSNPSCMIVSKDAFWSRTISKALIRRNIRKKNIKVLLASVEILHICNLWILRRTIVVYIVGRKFHLHTS